MLKIRLFFIAIILTNITYAQHKQIGNKANEHMHKRSVSELTNEFEASERDNWQKPNQIIELIGPVNGKRIIDIGSGSGYFSFRMVEAGAKVIAADVNDEFQEFIAKRKKELKISDSDLEIRKIPFDSPGIAKDEVDIGIIINTYHHIESRKKYFSSLRESLRKDGCLVVVDYVDRETSIGPPLLHRIDKGTVLSELAEAGYTHFEVNLTLLPYQYIIIAKNPN